MAGNRICWRAFGRSVCGASHARTGRPNQDAKLIASPGFLALADGHGSARYFRSHWGAWFAVNAAREVCRSVDTLQNPTALQRWVENDLPRALVRRRQVRVDNDLATHPPARQQNNDQPESVYRRRLIYGSTVLMVMALETAVFYLQLGDGDILTVSNSGEVSRPLPPDERLLDNETTSLCTEQAWRDVRTGFQRLTDAPPALILATTDGYPNSFRDEMSFLQMGAELLNLIREEGFEAVE
jgi:serine/threonine protein phosphatase PrpC